MHKNSSFFRQIVQLGSGALANLIIGVVTTPIITRLVDPAEFGQLNMFNTYSAIALMLLTAGLDQTYVRYYYALKDNHHKKKLFEFCLGFPIIVGLAGLAIIIAIKSLSPTLLRINNEVLIYYIINVFLLILNRFGLLVLRLRYKTAEYSLINVINKVIYVLLVIVLALIFKNYYFRILIISTLSAILISTFVSIIMERHFWFERTRGYSLPIKKRELLRYGLPLMVSSAVFLVFQATDRLCVNYYGTYTDVGIYSSAQSLMAVFSIIQTTFNTLWAPMAIDHYETDPDDRLFYIKMNQLITVIMFFFGACVLVGKDIFVLLLGEQYRGAAGIIPFLMFNPIMYTVSETTVVGLSITKHTSCQIVITLVSAVVNLVGNILLIPILGLKGAAISTGLSYIVFFTARTLFANHYFPTNYTLKKFYLLTIVFALGAWYHTNKTFDTTIILIFFITLLFIYYLYKDSVKRIVDLIANELFQRNKLNTSGDSDA